MVPTSQQASLPSDSERMRSAYALDAAQYRKGKLPVRQSNDLKEKKCLEISDQICKMKKGLPAK